MTPTGTKVSCRIDSGRDSQFIQTEHALVRIAPLHCNGEYYLLFIGRKRNVKITCDIIPKSSILVKGLMFPSRRSNVKGLSSEGLATVESLDNYTISLYFTTGPTG